MTLLNGSVLDPPRFLTPAINISPYKGPGEPKEAEGSMRHASLREYMASRFPDRRITMTRNGRTALALAIKAIGLGGDDSVAILTTSGNRYVSSCVTKAIECSCSWTRSIDSTSKAILVIHEFGFPFEGIERLDTSGLPIIEDCAHAFFSDDDTHSIGRRSKFSIFSLPKAFSVQFGGVLISRDEIAEDDVAMTGSDTAYLERSIGPALRDIEAIKKRRIENFRFLAEGIRGFGMHPRFDVSGAAVPGVFMFRTPAGLDLDRMKSRFQANGIEASVFYGERAFFIPVHQCLVEEEMRLMLDLVESCLGGSYGNF
jgi:hypothetical protein